MNAVDHKGLAGVPAEAPQTEALLAEALDSGLLPPARQVQASALLKDLRRTPRLSVLGPRQSGKSVLMNLLLGTGFFPKELWLPTVSLSYGETVRVTCTQKTGDVVTFDEVDMQAIVALDPVYVRISLPLPALKVFSMMEVVVRDEPEAQVRAAEWAVRRSDLAIWCTQESTLAEEAQWERQPDRLCDHAFLVVTKADQMAAEGSLTENLRRAHYCGADSFARVLSIDTVSAFKACKDGEGVDKEALRTSGGMALISAVSQAARSRRQGLLDAAQVLLEETGFQSAASRPDGKPALVPPRAQDALAPLRTAVAVEAPEEASLGDVARSTLVRAVDQLAAHGASVSAWLAQGDVPESEVVDASVETVVALADYLHDAELGRSAPARRSRDLTQDAADLMQLIQLETGDSVAQDAISVMIQLKQEIQAELAA